MTGQQIITKYQAMVPDDDLDPTYLLQLVNDCMHDVEDEVSPEGLKAIDITQSTTVGQTWATAIPLPTNFYMPLKTIFVGTQAYTGIPLEQTIPYQNGSNNFYIDHANASYHLTGTVNTAQLITFPYIYATPDIILNTSPAWPNRFHSLIPLKMAQLYYPADAGDKSRAWDDRWEKIYERRLARFIDYDASLKLAALNGQTPYGYNLVPFSRENRINDLA